MPTFFRTYFSIKGPVWKSQMSLDSNRNVQVSQQLLIYRQGYAGASSGSVPIVSI